MQIAAPRGVPSLPSDDVLDRALHREPDRLDHHDLIEAEGEARVAGEELLPADAHGVVADETRAARMDADDLLVLGPGGHHRVDVLRLERLVERQRGVRGCRVDRWRADLGHDGTGVDFQGAGRASATGSRGRSAARARSYTAGGARSCMHLKCPSGHSRLKHGLQAMSMRAILAVADIGGV